MKSLTTIPRFTFSPALRARSTLGRMPAATTTRSASMREPSANSTPLTLPCPRIAVLPGHGPGPGVDVDNPHAHAKVDAVLPIPVGPVDHDVVGRFLSRKHRREEHAVVVGMGLVAEDGHVEARRMPEDLLEACHARHAVADHHELFHG